MTENQEMLLNAYQLANTGNFEQAREYVEQALYDSPGLIEAWLLMADLVDTAEQAIECYQMVLKIDPNEWVARQRLQLMFSQSDDKVRVEPVPATDVLAPILADDFPEPANSKKPTLKQSFTAHRSFFLGLAGILVILFGIGLVSWVATVGFIVWKTNFLTWLGY